MDWTATGPAFVIPALGGLLFGYDIGITSAALVSLTAGGELGALSPLQSGAIVSASLFGAMAGACRPGCELFLACLSLPSARGWRSAHSKRLPEKRPGGGCSLGCGASQGRRPGAHFGAQDLCCTLLRRRGSEEPRQPLRPLPCTLPSLCTNEHGIRGDTRRPALDLWGLKLQIW